MTYDEKAIAIRALTQRVRPLFRGGDPDIVGGALADLTAIWLAGHVVPGDGLATAKLRDEHLRLHSRLIRQLTTINAKIMGTHF